MGYRSQSAASPAAFIGFVLGVVLMPAITCVLTALSPRFDAVWARQHPAWPWMGDVAWYGAGIVPLLCAALLYLVLPEGWRRFTGAMLAGAAALAAPVFVLLVCVPHR